MSTDGHENLSTPPLPLVNTSHPLTIGATVTVITHMRAGAPFIEGLAVIKQRAHVDHRYLVQFIDDSLMRERFVHPAYQVDPNGTLTWLRELWCASLQPECFEEFFPEDIP